MRIIDFALGNCVNSGLRRIGVLTQYKAQSLIRHVERSWGFLEASLGEYVDIVPAQQRLGRTLVHAARPTPCSRTWTSCANRRRSTWWCSAATMSTRWTTACCSPSTCERGADMSVACLEVPLAEAARVRRHGGGCRTGASSPSTRSRRIRPPMPGKPGRALASMGIYVFNADFLYRATRCAMPPTPTRATTSARTSFPRLVARPRSLRTASSDSCVNMVGDAALLARRRHARRLLGSQPRPDAGGARAEPVRRRLADAGPAAAPAAGEVRVRRRRPARHRGGFAGLRAAASSAARLVRRSILFYGARVGEGSLIEDSVVLPNVSIGRGVTLRRTIVDKGCVLPDGLQGRARPGRGPRALLCHRARRRADHAGDAARQSEPAAAPARHMRRA